MTASRSFRFSLLAAGLLLAFVAAAKEGPLDGMDKAWEEAFAKGDTAAVAAMYAEDGLLMPPNMAAVKGREGIAAFIKTMTDGGFSVKLSPTDTWVEGALGAKTGTYVVVDKDGKEMDHGKWIEVWRRGDDGKWLMARDIWNSNDPPPPPPTTGVSSDKK